MDDQGAVDFIGLSLRAAQELAVDRDLYVRNQSPRPTTSDEVFAFMDDSRHDRVNVWLDADDNVVRAEIF